MVLLFGDASLKAIAALIGNNQQQVKELTMFQVFHSNNQEIAQQLCSMSRDQLTEFILNSQNQYSKVAEVLTTSVNEAHALTTHKGKSWLFNQDVVFSESANNAIRSTSNGDLIVSDSQVYVVLNNTPTELNAQLMH